MTIALYLPGLSVSNARAYRDVLKSFVREQLLAMQGLTIIMCVFLHLSLSLSLCDQLFLVAWSLSEYHADFRSRAAMLAFYHLSQ